MRRLVLILSALTLTACSRVKSPETKIAPASETAPAVFRVNFDLSSGHVIVEVNRSDAPNGADRFYNLVTSKYFDEARFFRVVPGFIVQWGINGNPAVTSAWDVPIADDPVKVSNTRGTIVFATAGPNTRTTQLFINLVDNTQKLDPQGFAAFGRVVSGMDTVDKISAEYGESPQQDRIEHEGNSYLNAQFPHLDYIKTARIAE